VPPTGWLAAELEGGSAGLEVTDVVAGGPGFIAVGGGWEDGAEVPTAAIWTSVDGLAWSRVPLEGDAAVGQIRGVAATVDGFIAVGGRCCPDQALVWRSADGLTWEILPDDPVLADAALMAVAALPDGSLAAVGCSAVLECFNGFAWGSADGVTWDPPVELGLLPMDVTVAADGFVAVGSTDPYGGAPAGAFSPDGLEWTPGEIAVESGNLVGVMPFGIGALAVGVRDSGTRRSGGLFAGFSGSAWEAVEGVAVKGAAFEDAAWIGAQPGVPPGGLVVVGFSQGPQGGQRTGAWWSTDGSTWTELPFAVGTRKGVAHAIAVSPSGTIVAVGMALQGGEPMPAAWIAETGAAGVG
jgi:hypothetical protein